jgi:hypothetical protein
VPVPAVTEPPLPSAHLHHRRRRNSSISSSSSKQASSSRSLRYYRRHRHQRCYRPQASTASKLGNARQCSAKLDKLGNLD